MLNTGMFFVQSLGYVGIVAGFIWLAKFLSDIAAPFKADHLIEEDNNMAVALRRGGLYLAIAIAMFGSLSGSNSHGFIHESKILLLDGCLITVFLLIARKINDWFIIPGIDNNLAIKSGNVSVGLVEAGGYIATGIIAYASVIGTGGPWWGSLVYFGLGQLVLLLVVRIYELITPFEVIKDVKDGNIAAGLMLAGILIAMSFILRGAIAGPFGSWAVDLTEFAVSSGAGLLMILVIFNKFIDRMFLPGTDIRTEIERDKNVAAITVVVSVKVAMAMIIGAVVI